MMTPIPGEVKARLLSRYSGAEDLPIAFAAPLWIARYALSSLYPWFVHPDPRSSVIYDMAVLAQPQQRR